MSFMDMGSPQNEFEATLAANIKLSRLSEKLHLVTEALNDSIDVLDRLKVNGDETFAAIMAYNDMRSRMFAMLSEAAQLQVMELIVRDLERTQKQLLDELRKPLLK